MAGNNYMDDKLYEAARWSKGTELPAPPDDDDGFYYHRATPGDGSTALHVAAQHGNHRFVVSILSRVDPKMILYSHNTKGETPLHLGAESGSVETVEEILKSHDAIIDYDDKFGNSSWRARDKQGDTPVHTALRFGHDQIALLMLERDLEYLVTLRNDVGESLAYVAAQNSCPQFLRKILNADGDGQCCISFSGPFGQTAFHPARMLPGEIISIAIERKKHLLKAQDNKGKTVLHYAVEEQKGHIVKILLKADSTIAYLYDNDGMAPLHIAASRGFLQIIQMILELCPQSITISDKRCGQTALHFVKMDGDSLEKCLKNTRISELINQADNDGNTPLHLALMKSDFETADKLLLVDGINWRLTNKLGYSPLDLCSNEQIPMKLRHLVEVCMDKEVVKMDVFFNKNVVNVDDVLDHYNWNECLDFKGLRGDSILHVAARDGKMKILNRLHESDFARSLMLSGQNSKGETPLHLAAEYGHLKVVQFVISLTMEEIIPCTSLAIGNNVTVLTTNTNPINNNVKPWRITSVNGDTPTHKAIRNRHSKVALLLLQCDPDLITVNNAENESLLYLSAYKGCYDVTRAILSIDRGSCDDSITSGRNGQNIFHAAARYPGYYHKLYTSLVKRKPDLIKKVDDNGKTPLHYAVQAGNHVIIQWFLKQDKSAAFVYDNEGFTPLLRAAVLGRIKCIRWILTLCPQSAKIPDLRCNRNVLHLAKMPLVFYQFFMRFEALKQIVNETDKDGNTALHCAILEGDVDKALVLLETQGIDLTIRNNQEKSPSDLCQQLSITGETKQNAINFALASLSAGEEMGPRVPVLGSWLKTVLLAYNNLVITDESLKRIVDNIAVAAALLVAITFAAAFTIPGGYNQTTGDAMLMKKAAVQMFIASDILAMLMAISILIWCTLGGRRANLRKLAMDCIVMLQISLMATIVSFISGALAIGGHVKYAIIIPIVIALVLNLCFIFSSEFFEFFI